MIIEGEKVYIRPLTAADAEEMYQYRAANHAFLQPFEPIRPVAFYTLEGQRSQLQAEEAAFAAGSGYAFAVCERGEDKLVGRIALSGVARGPFQNANLGYSIARAVNGKGYATEAVSLILQFAFQHVGLHRVQAGTLIDNIGSQRVLAKNGFRCEGLAERYLQINGEWRDHNLYAITLEEWPKRAAGE